MQRRLRLIVLAVALASAGPLTLASATNAAESAPNAGATASVSTVAAARPKIISAGRYAAFVTPSGNMTCLLSADRRGRGSVRCDILSSAWRLPKKPKSCPLSWGHGVQLGRRASIVCAGDTVMGTASLGTANTTWFRGKRDLAVRLYGTSSAGVRYGYGLRVGDVTCVSTTKGVTCSNSAKHGFSMSRTSYSLR